MAIPVGTYVGGVLDKVTRGARSGPSLKMHFTRLDYVNGYSVDIEGANVQADALSPKPSSSESAKTALPNGSENLFAPQTLPQAPTLQAPASHIGTAIGIAVASAAAAIAIPLIFIHHAGGSAVLFDVGWQFEMVLESPLEVDAASVAAASQGQ